MTSFDHFSLLLQALLIWVQHRTNELQDGQSLKSNSFCVLHITKSMAGPMYTWCYWSWTSYHQRRIWWRSALICSLILQYKVILLWLESNLYCVKPINENLSSTFFGAKVLRIAWVVAIFPVNSKFANGSVRHGCGRLCFRTAYLWPPDNSFNWY